MLSIMVLLEIVLGHFINFLFAHPMQNIYLWGDLSQWLDTNYYFSLQICQPLKGI